MAPSSFAALAACLATAAHAQFVYTSQARSVFAQAQSSANGNTQTDGPTTRTGPSLGARWNTANSALASTAVARASAGASAVQVSAFSSTVIEAQGSASSSAIIGSTATTGSVQTRGESSCVFFFTLPANQRLQINGSQTGSGIVRITRTDTAAVLFNGSGIATLVFPVALTLRFEASALATISSTTVPTSANAGGSFSALLTNLDAPVTPPCDSIDFNNDSLFPADEDLIEFLNVLAGAPCSVGDDCNDIDFNNDGIFPDDNDVIAFLRVLAGGNC